jgi:HNH endonuclease
MEVEHILPEALDRATEAENLCLSCRRCNGSKGSRTHGMDPVTQADAPFFNPRTQSWGEHFEWSEDSTRILGKTPEGRATRPVPGNAVGSRAPRHGPRNSCH